MRRGKLIMGNKYDRRAKLAARPVEQFNEGMQIVPSERPIKILDPALFRIIPKHLRH